MKDSLNNKLLFSDDEIIKEYSMKKLIRYNNKNRITDEDIAQHSYFVSLFCLKIFSKLDLDLETKYKILVKSILHDTSEIELSDIPYDIKKNHPEIKKIMESLENEYYKENWKEYLDIVNDDNKIVEYIVKLADVYSVRQYSLNEITLGNNDNEINQIYEDSFKRIKNEIQKIEREIKND